MKLIGRYSSPYVRRVAVTLRVYDFEYSLDERIPFGEEKAFVREHNPLGRVPILITDRGETLVESAAIIDYLDDRVGPQAALTPGRGIDRRRVVQWVGVATGAMDKLVSSLYEHHLRPPEKVHRPWVKMCDRQVQDGFRWLNSQLVGPWFAGERMTQADLSVAVFWQFGCEKRPNFFARMNCAALERVSERLRHSEAFTNTLPAEGLAQGIALE